MLIKMIIEIRRLFMVKRLQTYLKLYYIFNTYLNLNYLDLFLL
jgi:hypothetical protein